MHKSELTHKEIISYLTNKFPLNLAEKWDESGLKKFTSINDKLSKVLLCLDVTNEVISYALKQKIKLIISHHPIFIKSKEIKTNLIDLKNLNLLKKSKINLLSFHTNVDNNKYGLNYYLAKVLNLGKLQQLRNSEGSYYKVILNKNMNHKDLVKFINKKFQTIKLSYIPSNDLIKSIYICSGAGFSIFKNISYLSKYDLLITGDVKWHDWIYISQSKYHVIDVGHDLEKFFIDLIYDELIHRFQDLKIIKYYPTINLNTLNK